MNTRSITHFSKFSYPSFPGFRDFIVGFKRQLDNMYNVNLG